MTDAMCYRPVSLDSEKVGTRRNQAIFERKRFNLPNRGLQRALFIQVHKGPFVLGLGFINTRTLD